MTKQVLQDDDEERLTMVFRDIFNDPALMPADTMTAADVKGWDSFNHINLVMAIEKEFNIRFKTNEIVDLTNVGDLKVLIASKI